MAEYQKALVTGGAGFIGSYLCKGLIKNGLEVIVIDNLSMGKKENLPDGVDFILGDIIDESMVREVVMNMGIDIIFHQAAKVSVRASIDHFYDDAENNIMGTLNLLRACKGSPVKRFIYASSMAVYADSNEPKPINEDFITNPISPYGASKLSSEIYSMMITDRLGIDCIVLRYFNTYGKGQRFTPYVGVITIFVNRIKEGEPLIIYGNGNQCRDFVHVSDIVHANILAMEKKVRRGVFNIGTGRPTSINRLAQIIRDKMDPNAKVIHLDDHHGELKNSIADISKAKEVLGYWPEKALEDAIHEVI
ncbi:MAG: NAD-dependent epimerase/dehydratase family protein [Nitrospinae bacterium]|nr:NAD-dependent epimerase/dehydratase family protein [Nitrospinota bacterium]